MLAKFFAQLFNHKKTPAILGLLLVGSLLYVDMTDNRAVNILLNRFEWLVYDYRMQLTHYSVAPAHKKIVIINIDDKSLQKQGRWPWSRETLADLTQKIIDLGVNVVAFDIQFSEKESIRSPYLNQRIKQLKQEGKDELAKELLSIISSNYGDKKLAQIFSENDVVLGFTFHSNPNSFTSGTLPEATHFLPEDTRFYQHMEKMLGYSVPIDILNQQEQDHEQQTFNGFINASTDADGTIRKSKLFLNYQDKLYASLSLESVRLNLLADQLFVKTYNEELAYFSFAKGEENFIPVQRDGSILIPYRGTYGSFEYISAIDILEGKVSNPGTWEIALIGSAAPSLFDSHSTPVQQHFPGIEIQANIIAGLLDNHFPVKPEWNYLYNDLFIFLVGGLLALIFPHLSPSKQLTISLLFIASIISLDFYFWKTHYYALDSVLPLLTLIVLTLFNVSYGFLKEFNKRRSMQQMFGQYIPPQLVEQMSKTNESFGFDGERRVMTVLFADIRNFTSLSESLSANELKNMLNAYFTPMTEIIFNGHGTIDKYVGDMIMAFWGAPLHDKEHALNATTAALKMLETTEQLKPEFKKMGFPEVSIGVGLNTGEMNVGNMGSSYRKAYTVLGDHVNLGSRLEGLTKNYGVKLIISEYTYQQIKDIYAARMLDKVRVKGRAEALSIYEPIATYHSLSDEETIWQNAYQQAIERYYLMHWGLALKNFESLLEKRPDDKTVQIYIERCQDYLIEAPEENWDGIYTHLSK
ncbi:MAG: adenylate/guanylate cyclase domain-containing protein [Gammaproteobacteria bacterium]|nr:adenylate/guanylate cyclase domain-containing protein [Gammaproteobacteria bacterium]